ncbi:MAG: DNA gyrase C-terminal beta-propeller domain-containing protein, partial [Caldicoprobacterales bacterium]
TKTIAVFDEKGFVRKYTSTTLPDSVKHRVLAMCNEDEVDESADVIFITTDGQIKKSAFREYVAVRDDSLALKLNSKAKVASVFVGDVEDDILIITEKGFVIRFGHSEVRQIGRIGIGVRAIRLEDGDRVVGAITASPNSNKELQIQISSGNKKLKISRIAKQGRGGKGSNFFAPDKVIKIIGAK